MQKAHHALKHKRERRVQIKKKREVEEEEEQQVLFLDKKMPTVWLSFKKSLHCRSEPSEVHDPKTRLNLSTIFTKKAGRSGCSRSIANLRDVINGSKRHLEKPPSCSPRSIGSSELLNPITHEVILNNSRCELRISTSELDSSYIRTPRIGTQALGHHALPITPSFRGAIDTTPPKKCASFSSGREGGLGHGFPVPAPRLSHDIHLHKSTAALSCLKCGEKFVKWEILEAHHLSVHAVSELVEGDSSRKIVEIICRTGWSKTDGSCGRIDRILKIHNTQRTLSRFEEYRDLVKMKTSKLPKKHPRCLADGNELLRFHGATIACSLGTHGSSSLCTSEKCSVCKIIRNGFPCSSGKEERRPRIGVLTTSTSGRALQSIEIKEDGSCVSKALLVCRVIAGRVHKPLDNYQELVGQRAFDSMAGKVGPYANIEELYLLNSRALLPCFVVIFKA